MPMRVQARAFLPLAVAALRGCAAIVHAGDIGRPEVLEGIRAVAPVTVVRGNVNLTWAVDLPDRSELRIGGRPVRGEDQTVLGEESSASRGVRTPQRIEQALDEGLDIRGPG
jgi:hypothetical protein